MDKGTFMDKCPLTNNDLTNIPKSKHSKNSYHKLYSQMSHIYPLEKGRELTRIINIISGV